MDIDGVPEGSQLRMIKELAVFVDGVKSGLGSWASVTDLSLSEMTDLIHAIDIVCIHMAFLYHVASVQ
jgi:hypothetical protein